MTRADDRLIAFAAVTSVALVLAGTSFAAATQSPVQDASIRTYFPEVQRLVQAEDWAGLEKFSRQVLSTTQEQAGADSGDVAVAATWLGGAVLKQGRYAEAEALYRRALAILEKADGPEDPETAMSAKNLADLLRGQHRPGEAEPLYRRVVAIREKTSGPEHPDTATSLSDLADSLQAQGRSGEAEPLYRRALAIYEKALGPEHRYTATAISNLAFVLKAQGRDGEAEPLYRRALSNDEKAFGPEHPNTAASLDNLAYSLESQGRYADAEPLYRRALAIREKVSGPEHSSTAASLDNLAYLLLQQSRCGEAEPLFRRALAIGEKTLGPEHPDTLTTLNNLAILLQSQGRYAEAEAMFRRVLSTDEALRPEQPDTAASLNNLAAVLRSQGRFSEAEPLFRRALAIREKVLGPEHPDTALSAGHLANLLWEQGRYSEAEPLLRRALAIDEKALGPEHPTTAAGLSTLAILLTFDGHPAEAEPLARRALAIDEKALGTEHPEIALTLSNLAGALRGQGRYADAEPLIRRALAISEKALGTEHPSTVTFHRNVAYNDESLGKFDDAAANYRLACTPRFGTGQLRDRNGDSEQTEHAHASACSTRLSLVLWAWSARSGGIAPGDRPQALMVEAFLASQRAVQSAAGDAMARSAAFTAANSGGVGPDARAYEAALQERDGLDQQYAKAVGDGGQRRDEKLRSLSRARDEVLSRIERLESALKSRSPLYWDYRSPEPVSVAALQSRQGADASLLREDEALITFLVAPGQDRGLVFAVSKDHFAWAQLGLTGDELKSRVTRLRSQIDPEGYGLRGIAVKSVAGADSGPQRTVFDRQAAYELYQALLGDNSIQAVIRDKPILLFVPSGPLTSLPPALLVTAPPEGGESRDADPATLRATAWLLRSKAVALLPATSSLRTLRQILPGEHARTTEPLLAFVDPDFEGTANPKAGVAVGAARGFSTFFRDGLPLAEALNGLPRLPGTRIEGEALQRALGATPSSVLTGRRASKAELIARNADGRLSKVRVLEFATHGLVAGDASDLAEPALALAAGVKPQDELLLASEAATLRLNADWVLLSACNTASPDAPEAQGLSGLSRAFFYAGAKSLLVSHWRVRDDVAPLLIPAMLLAGRTDSHLSRAQALRQATLAILDNPGLNASAPSAWAPFTLIGEAGR